MVFGLFGMHVELLGWERLPEAIRGRRQPVIFMANHESLLDPPVLMGTLPIPAVYLSKREILWMVPVGWAAMMAGTILVDRSNREKAFRSLKRAAAQIRGGKNVVLFPEGTRTRTGEMGPFKKGGFALALDAGTPIVPLGIGGAFQMFPPGSRLVRCGHYVVAVGDPVDPSGFASKDELMEAVRERVAALRAEAKERIRAEEGAA
jgi:1-acyl-sn-glycerol-3-phosphate acyltransferase